MLLAYHLLKLDCPVIYIPSFAFAVYSFYIYRFVYDFVYIVGVGVVGEA